MEVKTKADKSATIGEMQRLGEPELGILAEMVTDPARLDDFIPGLSAKGRQIAGADDAPEFAILRVEEGWSGSKRLWPAREIDSIVRQVNELEPVGHLGHIPDDQEAFAFPDPQTTWIGAVAKTEGSQLKERLGEQVRVGYFAGYNYPDAKIRSYIKRKAVRGISWWGRGEQTPIPGRGVEVRNFVLKSLDWARKLSEGMPSARIVAITGEQETAMAKELAQVTPDEFKAENPNGYALLVREVTAEKDTRISEIEGDLEGAKRERDLLKQACAAVGIENPDELLAKIDDLKSKIGEKAKATLDSALDKILKEKVADDDKRALVKRLLPVSEMESKLSDAKPEETDKLVGELVTASFDSDDMIKQIVGEMQPPTVRRSSELKNSGSGDANPYTRERERVTFS
jgi:hypothetical protein